jgi:hypothetical protein
MSTSKPKTTAIVALSLLALTISLRAQNGNDRRAPTVPANLVVPGDGYTNMVSFHAYAIGVQIYIWNGSSWVFKAPQAVLYDDDGNIVATHFLNTTLGLPEWKSNSGSDVVGMRQAASSVNPPVDPNAIPWLLLEAVSTAKPGVLAATTYVQRVNTAGGKAPSTAGTTVGQEADVPYTAEYYFYRAQ